MSRWHRLLVLAWVHGLVIVGAVHNAVAADGFIVAPDLGSTGGHTFFERFDVNAFAVPVDTDSDHDQLDAPMWSFVNIVTNLILWFGLALLRGALVALQWMLSLDLYEGQRAPLDAAVGQLNTAVFLPLVGTTLALAVFLIFTRNKRDGGDSYLGEFAWMLTAAVFAFTFMAQPSRVLDIAHGTATAVSDKMMTTYAQAANGGVDSATGQPAADTGGTSHGAIRQVTNGMWNVYGVSGWCYVAWASLDNCGTVGEQYLSDPQADSGPWGDARVALESDGDVAPFGEDTSWVRGQEPGRLGAAILISLIAVGAAAMLMALFFFGIMAMLGVAFLTLVACVFLAGLMIPGLPRRVGLGWVQALLGTVLQSVLIISIVGAVMVLGAIINGAVGQYGIFGVALLNAATLLLGLRYRAQFEHMLGMGTAATGSSVVSSYAAMRMLGGASRMGRRMIGGGLSATHAAGHGLGRGIGAAASSRPARAAASSVRARAQAASARLAPLRAAPAGGPPTPKPPPPAGGSVMATPTTPARPATSSAPPATPPRPPAPPAAPPRLAAPATTGRPAPAPITRPAPPPAPGAPSTAQPRLATARRFRPAPLGGDKK